MRRWNRFRYALGGALLAGMLLAQQEGPLANPGPGREPTETIARPKKKLDEPPSPPPPSRPKRAQLPADLPTFQTNTNLVNVDVAVLDNRGGFIPNIPKDKFLVLEDNVPQQIVNFGPSQAPMTVCMVIEFSNRYQNFWSATWYQTIVASYSFVQTLKPDDWVAVVAYDMRPEVLSDFTQDRRQTYEAMQRLRMAGFSESNLYDALTDTIDRMQGIEGRKAIVLISSGVDTFSRITFDKARRLIQEGGIPIYAVGLMQDIRTYYEAAGMMGPIQELDFLQADNQMRTFARETGGMSFFPRFYGEFPGIYQQISASLRNQYTLSYVSTNQTRDGKFRKIKVQLVDPETNKELRIVDQKGKSVKYQILAKAGYTAPREVE